MGGHGALLLGFKHPDTFIGLAAIEPSLYPVLTWEEAGPEHLFFLTPEHKRQFFGTPVDPQHWTANNPASIVHVNPDRIRDSGLQVYFDAGDLDVFWLYEGTEFLHQVLWNAKIPHEYHLVRGADHVGATLPGRRKAAIQFLGKVLEPPPHDPVAEALRERTAPMIRDLNKRDHYGLDQRGHEPGR